jgi:membrane protease YdiL (CAAX protease family)
LRLDSSSKATVIRPGNERWSGLAVIPIVFTVTYSIWSSALPASLWSTLVPQGVAYACLAVWSAVNTRRLDGLFIVTRHLAGSLRVGSLVGCLTGLVNLWVIVKLTPWLGYSFDFLRDTPHARMPFALMVPWGIVLIAVLVEVNFRGFLLGRLAAMGGDKAYGPVLAVIVSAVAFSRDPFMMTVFRGYHWLALTDGLIWGGLILRTRSLFSTMAAHAVEVILVYSALWIFYR